MLFLLLGLGELNLVYLDSLLFIIGYILFSIRYLKTILVYWFMVCLSVLVFLGIGFKFFYLSLDKSLLF